MSLNISEQFYSIQGEGRTIGVPAVFLRLKGCNLTCGGKKTVSTGAIENGASWRCDTIEVWTKGVSCSFEQIIALWKANGWIDYLRTGAHLVVTGGEPLLQQQELFNFITYFIKIFSFKPIIELESNATIMIDDLLLSYLDYLNISPKLTNSGMDYKKRIFPLVLHHLNTLSETIFKFVVANEEDVRELKNVFVDDLGLDSKKIYLMAAAQTKQDLTDLEQHVVTWCKLHCFSYSNRLHIQLWDQATSV